MLSNYITGATEDDAGDLFDLYPDIPALGSPFDTGPERVLGQYKRLAAIQGDLVFQAPRRFFLNNTAHAQPTWTFRTLFRNKKGDLVTDVRLRVYQ